MHRPIQQRPYIVPFIVPFSTAPFIVRFMVPFIAPFILLHCLVHRSFLHRSFHRPFIIPFNTTLIASFFTACGACFFTAFDAPVIAPFTSPCVLFHRPFQFQFHPRFRACSSLLFQCPLSAPHDPARKKQSASTSTPLLTNHLPLLLVTAAVSCACAVGQQRRSRRL